MTAAPDPRIRLAQYIERRISALALEYAEVCRRADISDETLSKVRKGMRARSSTYTKLERALNWERGSIGAILDGGEPTPLDAPPGRAPAARAPDAPPLERELALAQRLLAATIREMQLSPEEADEVWRRVRLEIEVTHRSPREENDQNEPKGETG
ncbi:hypothetical protein JHN59_37510 [Streptomyces sp. MBT49]|uniref:hypothetical protein n=1 Tax=Streptomyces sp. MBT49 TaxID=1488380 RepID=UPI00190C6E1D|nr:hypothetical protein [Streptomyces sp. MBT49]MBK3630400.1 hypothetical protein [Streptomyces sp. MBT49]